LRFDAGAPIHGPDGFAGSLRVIDLQPRQLVACQRCPLLELAAIDSDEDKLRQVLKRS
jgi:hypothetical protein